MNWINLLMIKAIPNLLLIVFIKELYLALFLNFMRSFYFPLEDIIQKFLFLQID